MKKINLLIPTIAAVAVCWAQTGQAKKIIDSRKVHASRPMTLDFVGDITWLGGGAGAGAHFAYSIVPDGFLPKVNDSFDLEGGATFYYYWGFNALAISPMAGVRWKFHLTNEWTVFGFMKLGARIAFKANHSSVDGDSGAGAYYHVNDGLALRMSVGIHGVHAGVSLAF